MAGGNFSFRRFDIRQERCAMKVGTDGVLLGAWAHGGEHILDIGTGTGLIALMMAQRYMDAKVDAVEIDSDAAEQARQNIAASPFADRIRISNDAIQRYDVGRRFDAIVSNPPFFVDALHNPDPRLATARHADTLTYAELFAAVKRLLAEKGEFSAVIPAECQEKFVAEAYMAGLAPSRRCAIRTTPRKQVKRYLVAFRHADERRETEAGEECLQDADGTRSEWYATITKDFYIK